MSQESSRQADVLLTGVGGQGIQLAAKTLAAGATAEGKQVLMSGSYGAEIRGGHSDATVCIAASNLRALPIVPTASHALVMHEMSWSKVRHRLRANAIVVSRSELEADQEAFPPTVVMIDANGIAADLGAPGSAAFVLLGAFAALTQLVSASALDAAMRNLVPSYRTDRVESNARAIAAGAQAGIDSGAQLVSPVTR